MRQRQCVILSALVLGAFCLYSIFRLPHSRAPLMLKRPASAPVSGPGSATAVDGETWEEAPRPEHGPRPKPVPGTTSHPIWYLLDAARRELEGVRRRQSTTLEAAVAEYRRRYGLPPPPHFDRWFEFARQNKVQLVDEFDAVHELLKPFWGLKPKTIRRRVREALGKGDNMLLGVAIRGGRVARVEGGPDWQRNATEGMMAGFVRLLPDMDVAFNIHDEPRVMVPHDDLARLLTRAQTDTMPAARAKTEPANDFSRRPASEVTADGSFDQVATSRFNTFAHQATWTHSRMSCPPDSPARVLEEDERADDLGRYAIGDLGFVYNATAMSDICLTPSLSGTYGFFDRPNAYSVVHDLVPIFSQSKISSYSDIIYPSPWYWYRKVAYDDAHDRPWARKADRLYWRGSTTGGFSRAGGWRRQHRQHLVHKINDAANSSNDSPRWEVRKVRRAEYNNLIDVSFSHVGQCDPEDCQGQKRFFHVKDRVDQNDAWAYKYLLDMDGNAFSGRFYAFLQSRSLTFKLAVFREWHAEWLKPWAHYVPLSLQGDDWLDAVRFFAHSSVGNNEAERMAEASREWANKVVRKVDMEAWFFRLMLEYARVIDENREHIGFHPSSASKKLTEPDDGNSI
ncbi:hypothetical protein L249_7182 [Ophiocordyceps polyrhachis-furcata BCC 54312]|uniref:Glycosyl transferase CAP10 domain-containing protein n=1 Tax=Ophiocordyceps polyrhachis-furcata BCC 54312 TaxID=1330021 RepID=A0A367L9L2_9HYPO|nr:hypothetical protein L249_7182 [Ophiocordyceps polyrhachis-furcata BCC 54312]